MDEQTQSLNGNQKGFKMTDNRGIGSFSGYLCDFRFRNAMQSRNARTENGMVTHSTSGSKVLDLFYKIGASRQISERDIMSLAKNAFSEDPLLTVKNMFYNRDIRGGQGERHSFRLMFLWLCKTYPNIAIKNLENVPFYGRWDDVFVALGTPVEGYALDFIAHALQAGDKLCAKWMPREGKSQSKIATMLRKYMGLTPKQYRKLLAGNTEVVENFMCQRDWGAVNYNHVPSMASNKYRRAFGRHDFNRYSEWLASLNKVKPDGTVNKIHADAIFPHTIVNGYIKNMRQNPGYGYARANNQGYEITEDATLEAQWTALPDYVPDGESFIPVCDLSGSMMSLTSLTPMTVSASLGIYLSQRNKGPFKDAYIAFSQTPTFVYTTGSLRDRLVQMKLSSIAENTNLEKVFSMILEKSVSENVPVEDMPRTILIISDMQFDESIEHPNATAMDMIRGKYSAHGYPVPNVVFWNVRYSVGVPVKTNALGVALVSGFSPSVMKNLLGGELNPIKVMLKTLNSERYERVVI